MQLTKYVHGFPVSCQMSVPESFGVPDSDFVGMPDSILFVTDDGVQGIYMDCLIVIRWECLEFGSA